MNKINVLLIFNSKLNQLIKISDEAFIPVVTNIIGENYPGYFKNTNRINIEEVNYDLFVLPSSDIKKTDLKNYGSYHNLQLEKINPIDYIYMKPDLKPLKHTTGYILTWGDRIQLAKENPEAFHRHIGGYLTRPPAEAGRIEEDRLNKMYGFFVQPINQMFPMFRDDTIFSDRALTDRIIEELIESKWSMAPESKPVSNPGRKEPEWSIQKDPAFVARSKGPAGATRVPAPAPVRTAPAAVRTAPAAPVPTPASGPPAPVPRSAAPVPTPAPGLNIKNFISNPVEKHLDGFKVQKITTSMGFPLYVDHRLSKYRTRKVRFNGRIYYIPVY